MIFLLFLLKELLSNPYLQYNLYNILLIDNYTSSFY